MGEIVCEKLRKIANLMELYDEPFVGKVTSLDVSPGFVWCSFGQIGLSLAFSANGNAKDAVRMVASVMMVDDDNRCQMAMLVAIHVRLKMNIAGLLA